MKKIFSIIFLLMLTTGCSNKIKEKMGLTTTAPDEFQVKRHKPLDVPPHYELNEPTTQSYEQNVRSGKGRLSKGEKALLNDIGE